MVTSAPAGHASKRQTVLRYSNRVDCRRYGLAPVHHTPWNWASRWVLEMTHAAATDRVIDLACGDNPYVLEHCARVGCPAVFVDIAPRHAGRRLPSNVTFVQHDLTRPLPFPDAAFDVALSISSLEHLRPAARLDALREALRVLRPGGRFAASIGYPMNVRDADTIDALATHPFFADRFCPVFLPVDVRAMLDALGIDDAPDNGGAFPGFDGFDERRLLGDAGLLRDDYGDRPAMPAIAGLRDVSVVEIGVFTTRDERARGRPVPEERYGRDE